MAKELSLELFRFESPADLRALAQSDLAPLASELREFLVHTVGPMGGHLAAGLEYRQKPRNLGADKEKDYYDAFVAWFPNKYVSVTAAYAVLGDITVYNPTRQKGLYLSVQAGF